MKISCIIPAHNEGKRIGNVLKILRNHHLVDEITVINDGSTDNTVEVVRRFKGVKLVNHDFNKGKSHTVMNGIKRAKYPILLLIDADLIGLTEKNVTDLIMPLKTGIADMSISLRKNAPLFWKIIGLDFISGERAFLKKIVHDHEKLKKMRSWGIESNYLNKKIIEQNLRLKVVKWDNVISPYPHKKHSYFVGMKKFFGMVHQILSVTGLFGSAYQIYRMLRLRV